MSTRPVFVALDIGGIMVKEITVSFEWFPGFSVAQKKRSVASMHAAAERMGLTPLLEISTKSEDALGQALSAFNFEVHFERGRTAKLEAVYHSSKVFERGGPFRDILSKTPIEAKRDARLTSSGKLVAFEFAGRRFPLVPRRAFYDWLYIRALSQNPALIERAADYDGFTDIEFNPTRSLNSQAHAVALAVALLRRGWLRRAAKDFDGLSRVLAWNSEEMRDLEPRGLLPTDE